MSVKIVYFAWVRERIGLSEETVDLPEHVETGTELIDWLVSRDDGYAHAFEDRFAIGMAVDHELADMGTHISQASEIAFFPPMTGG